MSVSPIVAESSSRHSVMLECGGNARRPVPAIDPRWLRFVDPRVELEFQQDIVPLRRRRATMALVCATGAVGCVLLSTLYAISGHERKWNALFLVDMGGAVPMAALLALSFRKDMFRFYFPAVALSLLIAELCYTVANTAVLEPHRGMVAFDLSGYYGVITACNALFHLPFFWTLVTMVLVNVQHNAFLICTGYYDTWKNLLFANLVGAIVWVSALRTSRSNERQYRMMWGALRGEIISLRKELGKVADEDARLDLDSPIEKVLAVLREAGDILDDDGVAKTAGAVPALKKKVSFALATLSKGSNLFAADLSQQIRNGNLELEEQTAKWLLSEISQKRQESASSLTRVQREGPTHRVTFASMHELTDVTAEMQRITQWNYNIWELHDKAKEKTLDLVGDMAMSVLGLYTQFDIDSEKLNNFLASIRRKYNNNPFHNDVHAADVVQGVCALLCMLEPGVLEPIECLALVIAAAVHDTDHPGTNNNFQVATQSQMAVTYNDRSVLENHHACTAWAVLRQEESNFVAHLPLSQRKEFRKLLIDLVFATDMLFHLDTISKFHTKIKSGFDRSLAEDRLVLMQVMLKLSDIGNIARPTVAYAKWSRLLLDEFYAQGERERELGLQSIQVSYKIYLQAKMLIQLMNNEDKELHLFLKTQLKVLKNAALEDLTACLPDDVVVLVLTLLLEESLENACSAALVCRRWHRLISTPPFAPWRAAVFRWTSAERQMVPSALVGTLAVSYSMQSLPELWPACPASVDPVLWGPHTLVLSCARDIAVELVEACRLTLRDLTTSCNDAIEVAVSTCPLLKRLCIKGNRTCLGFAERARAGLPSLEYISGVLLDDNMPPRDSPEGAMIAVALARVMIREVDIKDVHTLFDLGCKWLAEVTLGDWFTITPDEDDVVDKAYLEIHDSRP
eukprot:m51a1_g9741 putative camp phosphodiesterase (912) ;mRNA; r:1553937-1568042